MIWSGTNSVNGGIFGPDWKAERRRLVYKGMVWLERRAGTEELTSVEAWGDLTRMRSQLEGKQEVSEDEWKQAREMVVDTTKGQLSHTRTHSPSGPSGGRPTQPS